MDNIANDRVDSMRNPPHLGELVRQSMDDVDWKTTKHRMRMQASYELAQGRRQQAAGVRRGVAPVIRPVARLRAGSQCQPALT